VWETSERGDHRDARARDGFRVIQRGSCKRVFRRRSVPPTRSRSPPSLRKRRSNHLGTQPLRLKFRAIAVRDSPSFDLHGVQVE
jgi:hypothetical protein